MKQYTLNISLEIKGPIITSGGGDIQHGFNTIFFRNSQGKPIIQASHIKGKLREALKALLDLGAINNFDLNLWFGSENSEGDYRPEHGLMNISDFALVSDFENHKQGITSVSINPETGTSKENFLRVIENLFKSGKVTRWQGAAEFTTETDEIANHLKQTLIWGFKWITGIGASKGTGFGRLLSVEAEWGKVAKLNAKRPAPPKKVKDFHIAIELIDDLLVGGVRKTVNYIESEDVISGAVLKGSLASCLNRHCGVYPLYTPINESNIEVSKKFPELAQYFSKIKFSHAFPAPPNSDKRAVVVPFSTVITSKGFVDIAQIDKPFVDENGYSSTFQVDWKEQDKITGRNLFGWAELQFVNKTRTAIQPNLRSAAENKLYTFKYISPYEKYTDLKNVWHANIALPDNLDDELVEKIISQLYEAIYECWHYLGKRNSRVTISISEDSIEAKIASKSELENDKAIICLQTDAVMLNPDDFKGKNTADLQQKYSEFWDSISDHALKLSHFYASQKLAGGYLFHRYQKGKDYYPYLLTAAGSVFVLQLNKNEDREKAKSIIQDWKRCGLPVPDWVCEKYSKSKETLWEVFPFVPENGFGEIAVNLNWHWERELKNYREIN